MKSLSSANRQIYYLYDCAHILLLYINLFEIIFFSRVCRYTFVICSSDGDDGKRKPFNLANASKSNTHYLLRSFECITYWTRNTLLDCTRPPNIIARTVTVRVFFFVLPYKYSRRFLLSALDTADSCRKPKKRKKNHHIYIGLYATSEWTFLIITVCNTFIAVHCYYWKCSYAKH